MILVLLMQTEQQRSFIPETLGDWISVVGILVAGILFVWRVSHSLTKQIDGVGTRVTSLEHSGTDREARLRKVEEAQTIERQDRVHLHERVKEMEVRTEKLEDHLDNIKIDIVGHIAEVKALVTDRSNKQSERLVRLETIADIERTTGRKISDLVKEQEMKK